MNRLQQAAWWSVVALALTGCGSEEVIDAPPPALPGGEHAHAEHGPHGGQLIELGNDAYHAELVDDEANGKVTVYLLDSAAREVVPIGDQQITINAVRDGKPAQFQLAAVPADGGQSAQFELVDKALIEALHEGAAARCRLSVTINGKPYVGKIEHGHDGHGHDHKH